MSTMKRRDFLRRSLTATAGSAMFGSLLGKMSIAQAAIDTSGYKALVGIYLYGGNDSFNMIVPRDAAHYGVYAATRRALALPQASLLPLQPTAAGLPSDGAQYGFHPSMPGLQSLFNAGRAAIVGNVGPLVQPVTKAQYENDTAVLPPQLGSHSDQSVFWQTPQTGLAERIGWGGKLVDMVLAQSASQSPLYNIALDGENVFQTGVETAPYYLSSWGVQDIDALRGDWNAGRRATFDRLMGASLGHPMQRAYRDTVSRTREMAAALSAAIEASENQVPNTAPPYAAFDDDSYIGQQLRMVARMLAIRGTFALPRQVFAVGCGAFDTHSDQLTEHAASLAEVSAAMKAFYDATVALGIQDSVTTFTMSEFGRTLTINGDGTDHGWGGHQLVVGGAVLGQRFYGHMPNLAAENNTDDLDSGQVIPRLAVEQYGATLARWFGLPDSDRALVFPNLSRFGGYGGANLGFLA